MRRHPVHTRFHELLIKVAKERHLRWNLVEIPGGVEECEWVVYERGIMHDEVNRVREENGLPPVSLEEVMRREMWARGHADYGVKFALYCAELALQVDGYKIQR